MTGIIDAIGMDISWTATLMAPGNDIFRYPFPQPLIEYKILADEIIWKIFLFHLIHIMNDPSFQMIDIFETHMKQIGT